MNKHLTVSKHPVEYIPVYGFPPFDEIPVKQEAPTKETLH